LIELSASRNPKALKEEVRRLRQAEARAMRR
jgi:hypothetical protein